MQKFGPLIILLVLATTAVAGDLAVTVYNSNLGVVSETRQLEFKKGTNTLAFRDVPALIDAASVRFDLPGNGKVSILEQNYAYDLVSPEQMYRKYIDQAIELIDKDGKLYSGTLLAYSQGAVTLLEKTGKVFIVLLANITQVTFPALPEGLITRPTLFWRYQSEAEGNLDTRVSYQTGGMSWTAEYVGVLDKTEGKLDLSGWASINNESGKRYENATLRLVAGDISRATPKSMSDILIRGGRSAEFAAAPGFEEKAFFEYHLYTLPRTATLADKEMKQISLFEPAKTTVQKEFVFAPEENGTKVKVAIKFKNSKQTGLGMPLPEGRVRLFKADDDGALILLGEDMIDHTPKDEELDIKVGYAFDISAEERLVNQRQVSGKVEEREYEVELRNHKAEPVTVKVDKKLWGFWEVVKAGFEYRKKDVNTLQFNLNVPANDTTVAKYTVRFTQR